MAFPFIHLKAIPAIDSKFKIFLYASKDSEEPNYDDFDISSIDEGENNFYIPFNYTIDDDQKFFHLGIQCTPYCDFELQYSQEMFIEVKRNYLLKFLTFDYSSKDDFIGTIIKFNKSENSSNIDQKLMVTANGGGRGHAGAKNNVKMKLFYHNLDDSKDYEIKVNDQKMFNGAGITFYESEVVKPGNGYFLAYVKAPIRTYIHFMVREIESLNQIDVNGGSIYGFLKGDDILHLELTGYETKENKMLNQDKDLAKKELLQLNSENFNKKQFTDNPKQNLYMISILVKGDLRFILSQSQDCDFPDDDIMISIVNEQSFIYKIATSQIELGFKYVCLYGDNEHTHDNAFIVEIQDITNQLMSTIVRQPLVNGYIYDDFLSQNEVRTYRHSKYLGVDYTKYSVKAKTGIIKAVYIRCETFPKCEYNKEMIEGSSATPVRSTPLIEIDKYFSINVYKNQEYHAYHHIQILLTVLCLSESCEYSVSFADEEDSLLIRENERISHYVSPGINNFYHFTVGLEDEVTKVIVRLRTYSGDAQLELADDCESIPAKRYYYENTEILEFYNKNIVGLYSFKIVAKKGSFYMLSYNIFNNIDQKEEDFKYYIGFGVSLIETLEPNKTKILRMRHDTSHGGGHKYLTNFYPLNCKFSIQFQETDPVEQTYDIYQHIITPDDSYYSLEYFDYYLTFEEFIDESNFYDKQCYFYVSSQELTEESTAIVGEGQMLGFFMNKESNLVGFTYPHAAGHSEIMIKYNLENNYPIQMKIKIKDNEIEPIVVSRSSYYLVSEENIKLFCSNPEMICPINIKFEYSSKPEQTENNIFMNVLLKSKDKVPLLLKKNALKSDVISIGEIQYYMIEIGSEEGDILLNFKQGSGKVFGKIVSKYPSEPEKDADWKNKVKLPTPDEETNIEKFNYYSQSLHYDSTKLIYQGENICINGCELFIGVKSEDEIIESLTKNYQEFNILVRPKINVESKSKEEKQKKIKQVSTYIPKGEYVMGRIDIQSYSHYYLIDISEDCDYIEIEYQSETCSLYIREGEFYPDEENYPSNWTITSQLSNSLFRITKEDLKVKNLKGKKFKFLVKNTKTDYIMDPLYILRARLFKSSKPKIFEINSQIDTICEVTEDNGYCDFVIPLNDNFRNTMSSLLIYTDTDIVNDVTFYFNRINGYEFDSMNEEEIKNYLPREDNYQKTSKEQNNKNYIHLYTLDIYVDQKQYFALISIRSAKLGKLTIYSSMKEQLSKTLLSSYADLLYNLYNQKIEFDIKPEYLYTFEITCLDGEGEAYFRFLDGTKNEDVIISGTGNKFIIKMTEKIKQSLVINPTHERGLKFLISEYVFPNIRSMNQIKYGFSGQFNYGYEFLDYFSFPIYYYTKINDINESINVNLKLSDISIPEFIKEDMQNYTHTFKIYGYVMDEERIMRMLRNKKVMPIIGTEIEGRFDKSINTAKLYISSSQIKNADIEGNKFVLISFLPTSENYYTYSKFKADLTIMPFNNNLYFIPNNIYISGNLLKDKDTPLCNIHKLRTGNMKDKYMKIEFSKISPKIKFSIKDDTKDIIFIDEMKEKYGKFKGVVEVQENSNIYLEVCKDKAAEINMESSLNYIFKIRTSEENNFDYFSLDNTKVTYEMKNENLTIFKFNKILNKEKTKAVPAYYYLRIYNKYAFDSDENAHTISFINYYPYSVYRWDIDGIDGEGGDSSPGEISISVEKIPKDTTYYISVIGITYNNEEIFAYDQIDYEQEKEESSSESESKEETSNTHLIVILVIIVVIILVLVVVFVYVYLKMKKREKSLEDQLKEFKGTKIINEKKEAEPESDPLVE